MLLSFSPIAFPNGLSERRFGLLLKGGDGLFMERMQIRRALELCNYKKLSWLTRNCIGQQSRNGECLGGQKDAFSKN